MIADSAARAIVAAIDHAETHVCVAAERALLAALVADCHSPVAALATIIDGRLSIRAQLLAEDGSADIFGTGNDPALLAADLLARAPDTVRRLFAA